MSVLSTMARALKARARKRSAVVSACGCAAAVLLHALFLSIAVWGSRASQNLRQPEETGAGANTAAANGESTDRMIVIFAPVTMQSDSEVQRESFSPVVMETFSSIAILGPDSSPLAPLFSDVDGEATDPSEADVISRQRLVGLYEGQIRARIERAWSRPRDALHEPDFHCQVRISQELDGTVSAVNLNTCNGDSRWQRSLMTAVYAASPLPAPPTPSVFVDAFTMSFHAVQYSTGGKDEGYEGPRLQNPTATGSAAIEKQDPPNRSPGLSKAIPDGNVVLRISGDRIEWIPADTQQKSEIVH